MRQKFFAKALFIAVLSILWACAEDDVPELSLLPDSGLIYSLFPNDPAINDSASANLSHGVVLYLHPRGEYELSFEIDKNHKVPELQLYRLYTLDNDQNQNTYGNKVRTLKPVEENGRYVYKFKCEENKIARWATTLNDGKSYFTGTTNLAKLKGEGAFSNTLSLNFIVVGKVKPTADGFTEKELASLLLENFRRYYSSIKIDTLYIRYAHEHPNLGQKFRADEPWLVGKSSNDMMLSELGGWPETDLLGALDIVYVHRIEEEGIMGYADLFGGNLEGGNSSTVIIGNHVKFNGGEAPLTASEIISTALHETGHFFGLRHTTTTTADFSSILDYSVYEDGFEDTPYCVEFLFSPLAKKNANEQKTDFNLPHLKRTKQIAALGISSCPDFKNMMFPLSDGQEYEGFSDAQLELIEKNLRLFPH